MIQKGEIVEASKDEYGWSVRPNKQGRHDNFWVMVGTELEVTAVLANGVINVRYVASGMGRTVFRFDAANVRQVRQVGVPPAGAILPSSPGLAWLWEDAARLADRFNFCEEFDRLTEALGVPGRERSFRIPMLTEDGMRITATVVARSRELAEQRIRDRMTSAEPLALTAGATS